CASNASLMCRSAPTSPVLTGSCHSGLSSSAQSSSDGDGCNAEGPSPGGHSRRCSRDVCPTAHRTAGIVRNRLCRQQYFPPLGGADVADGAAAGQKRLV